MIWRTTLIATTCPIIKWIPERRASWINHEMVGGKSSRMPVDLLATTTMIALHLFYWWMVSAFHRAQMYPKTKCCIYIVNVTTALLQSTSHGSAQKCLISFSCIVAFTVDALVFFLDGYEQIKRQSFWSRFLYIIFLCRLNTRTNTTEHSLFVRRLANRFYFVLLLPKDKW